jgi:hypothetical protein
MVVAISPPPAHMDLGARREGGWDTVVVREPSSSLLLSFLLGCADIRTHSCAPQGPLLVVCIAVRANQDGRFAWMYASPVTWPFGLPRPALSPAVIGVEVQVIRARGRRYGRAGGSALRSGSAGVAHPDRRRDPADLRCGRCFRPSRSISSTSAAAVYFLSSTLGSSRPWWGA